MLRDFNHVLEVCKETSGRCCEESETKFSMVDFPSQHICKDISDVCRIRCQPFSPPSQVSQCRHAEFVNKIGR